MRHPGRRVNWRTDPLTEQDIDRLARELTDLLTPALKRLDLMGRTTPTQLLMTGQCTEPSLFDEEAS